MYVGPPNIGAVKAYKKLNSFEGIFMLIWGNNNLAKETENTKCPDCYAFV